jgi:hypothetical protein
MRILVDETCLREGIACDCSRCPVAIAIRQAGAERVTVGTTSVTVNGRNYPLPAFVVERILAIDDGRKVRPFEFELALQEDPRQLQLDLLEVITAQEDEIPN